MQKTDYRIFPIFFLIILIALVSALAANQFFIENINSDFLYGYETATNLIHHHLQGQNFPIAPYYFPDLLLVMLLNTLTSNITLLNYLYSIIFLFGFTLLVYNLIRSMQLTPYLASLGAMTALITFFFIIPPGMPLIREWPFSHLSVLLFSLYLLNDYIRHRTRDPKVPAILINGILIYAILISDNLLFVQLLVPLSVLILFDLLFQKSNKKFALSLLAIFFVTALLSAKTPAIMTKLFGSSVSYNVSLFRIKNLAHLNTVFAHTGQLFVDNIRANPLFYAMILLYNTATLILFALLYIKNKGFKGIENLTRILGFFVLAECCNLILATLVGKITETAHFRYLDILYIYPGISLALVITFLLQKNRDARYLYSALTLLFITCTLIFVYQNSTLLASVTFKPPYNNTIQCLDNLQKKYALEQGLADYWHVRPVRMLSKNHLQISQINNKLSLENFIDNRIYFYSDIKNKTPLTYQFIIADNLPTDLILKNIGRPDSIAMCPGAEVWLYLKKDSAAKLNQYFSPQLIE
ncbi:MAG: hypothetical protein P4M14_05300 [Gammaproteobacteria bacterium]|nr:hypothetical protein [Gammaproteobacteria bacterium]